MLVSLFGITSRPFSLLIIVFPESYPCKMKMAKNIPESRSPISTTLYSDTRTKRTEGAKGIHVEYAIILVQHNKVATYNNPQTESGVSQLERLP